MRAVSIRTMSNLERDPDEVLLEHADGPEVQILEPREVPLGGPRALAVRRTLPQRRRSLIGAWCFVDHYGPTPSRSDRVMDVPPHPHTGLQTVTWLFAGTVEHRDSVGSSATIRPGQVNLMTAGSGIQHSERSQTDARGLHGVQLWTALPDAHRHDAPFFEQADAHPLVVDDAGLQVFAGSLDGAPSPVTTLTPLLGAQLDLPAGGSVALTASPGFEYGLLVDAGEATLQGRRVAAGELAYLSPGCSTISVTAGDEPLRAVLLGGEPLGEPIVMWWNFVGRSHDEIDRYRAEWQQRVEHGPSQRFGGIDDPAAPLPAPTLPGVRLRPRT